MPEPTPEGDLIELRLPCQARYIAVARLAVSGIAARIGLTLDDVEDLKVAVSEACTNVIDHAFGSCAPDQCMTLRCWAREGELRVEVIDAGCGFEATEPPADRPDSPQPRGLGLFLIRELMDEVQVLSSAGAGTTVRMVKRAGEEQEPQ